MLEHMCKSIVNGDFLAILVDRYGPLPPSLRLLELTKLLWGALLAGAAAYLLLRRRGYPVLPPVIVEYA
jgi:hypothetical protein